MLVQILSLKSEKYQHLLMALVFFVFILYSGYTSYSLSLFLVIPIFIFCIIGVLLLMRSQMQNRVLVQPQVYYKGDKRRIQKRSIQWVVYPFIIYTILTIVHFTIIYSANKPLLPLFYDYGLGGLLALGFNIYIARNWYYGLCDEGIILGSKFDSKLIKWDNVNKVVYSREGISIIMKNSFPIRKLCIPLSSNTIELEKLLKYKT